MFFIAAVTTADFWRQSSSSSSLPTELRGILNAKICDQQASFCLGKNWPNILFYVSGDLRGWNVKCLKSFIVITEVCRQVCWIIRECNDAGHYHSFSVGTNTVIFTCIMPNIQGDKEHHNLAGWLLATALILYSLVSPACLLPAERGRK